MADKLPAEAASSAENTLATQTSDAANETKPESQPAVRPPAVTVEDEFSDPDEDDLDDLDDLLDDFSSAKIDAKTPTGPGPSMPATSATPAPAAASGPTAGASDEPSLDDLFSEADFAKQLQAGMADLLGGMETTPEMQAQLQSLFKEFGEAMPGGGAAPTAQARATASTDTAPKTKATGAAAAAAGGGKSGADASSSGAFNETIRRTMERMQASGEQATAAAAADTNSGDDLLSELMKQMQSGGGGLGGLGGLGGAGAGSDEDLSKMLMGMMEELTNKEILYEPMKELDEKFPGWFAQNRASTAAEDLKRYEEQQRIVREIVARFEQPGYSDTNAADREYIVDRMQLMQAAGSPPADLVGDMPSAQDAMAAPDDTCNQQ